MYFGKLSLEDLRKNIDIKKIHAESVEFFKTKRTKGNHYPYELEKRLNRCLMEGDAEELQTVATEFSKYTASSLCNGDSIRSLKNSLICSCALTTRILIKAGIDEEYAYFLSDLYINRIESLNDEKSLVLIHGAMLLDYMDQINKELIMNQNIHSELILNTVSYIDHHIYEQLSLVQVAEAFNTNSSYLSRLFKQEVGSSFTEYLHNCRIKKAQHLLHLTNMPIVDISEKLCYTSQSHFTSVFKRISGLTPKQYRLYYEKD